MLLISWPVELDQFFEGNNVKSISAIIGSTVTAILFLFDLCLEGYYTGVVLIISVLLIFAGSFQACKN